MNNPDTKKTAARRRVTFTYYAPRAGEVCLSGDFNRWGMKVHAMKKDPEGIWRKILYLYPGRYEYLFVEDGKWCCDPLNLNRCPNCYGSDNNIIEIK